MAHAYNLQYGDAVEEFAASLETRTTSELREMLVIIGLTGKSALETRAARQVKAELYARTAEEEFEAAALADDASEWKRRQVKAAAFSKARQLVAGGMAFKMPTMKGNRPERRNVLFSALTGMHVRHFTPAQLRQTREIPALLRAA